MGILEKITGGAKKAAGDLADDASLRTAGLPKKPTGDVAN